MESWGETILYNLMKLCFRNSKGFIESMQDCTTVIYPQSTPSPVSLTFLLDNPITLLEKLTLPENKCLACSYGT